MVNTFSFLVTGDTHLDVSYPIQIRKDRINDFNFCFKQIIDIAIEEKVNAILFLGDLFDNYRPSPNTVNFIKEQLVRLKKEKITFYTIFGNHDATGDSESINYGISIDYIKLAEDNIVELIDPRFDFAREIETVGYRDFNKYIRIYGVGCYKNGTLSIINNYFSPQKIDKNKFNILLLHSFIDKVNNIPYSKEKSIPLKEIEKFGFNVVATGHLHFSKHKNGFFNPSSTIYLTPGSPIDWNFSQLGTKKVCIFTVTINDNINTNIRNFQFDYKYKNIISNYFMDKIVIENIDNVSDPQYYKNKILREIEDRINSTNKKLILSIKIKGKFEDNNSKPNSLKIQKEILEKYGSNILFLDNIKITNLKSGSIEIEEENIEEKLKQQDELIIKLFKEYFPSKISNIFIESYNEIKKTYDDNYNKLLKDGKLPKIIREPLNTTIKNRIINSIKNIKDKNSIINNSLTTKDNNKITNNTKDFNKNTNIKSKKNIITKKKEISNFFK